MVMYMRKVELRMNEQLKYEVIKDLVDHNGNKNRASKKLGLSRRQIDRLINLYKEKGKSAFVHGNRSRKPASTLDKSISEDIILLYRNKYQGWNFKHFYEWLVEKENFKVSYKFVYNVLVKEGILSPKARKKTKREAAKKKLLQEKKINLTMSEEQMETIISHEIALEDSHPRGEKPKYFGEVIEQDGSIHLWFGETKSCLHLAIDKATFTIVGAYFDTQETLNGYYHVLYQILINYGIPYKFFTDNRTVFNYMLLNPDKRISEKDVLTPRKIDNGNAIKYKNKYYQPYLNGELKCFMPKTECLVIKAFDNELLVTIDDQVYELKKLSRNERFSKNFEEVPVKKERDKYIPPMNHPWRLSSFKKQIQKAHTNHVYA